MLYLVFYHLSLLTSHFPCPKSEGHGPQRQSILPWNVKQTRGADYLFAINVYSLWCEQAYQTCVHAWGEVDWGSACVCRFACMHAHFVCVWVWAAAAGGAQWGRVKHWQRTVFWCVPSPAMTLQPLITAGSQAHVFRWARQSGAVEGLYGRPQQGLNVCGSVSHSVSPFFPPRS